MSPFCVYSVDVQAWCLFTKKQTPRQIKTSTVRKAKLQNTGKDVTVLSD